MAGVLYKGLLDRDQQAYGVVCRWTKHPGCPALCESVSIIWFSFLS
jgi:hypothetical protein